MNSPRPLPAYARRTTPPSPAPSSRRPLFESIESRLLFAATIFVDAISPAVTPDGSSWELSFRDLQAALAVAQPGDTIHIADGTYRPTSGIDRTISFQLKSNVTLLGGFAGFNSPDPDLRNPTSIPTTLTGLLFSSDLSFNVLTASSVSNVTLDGLNITRGLADGSAANQDRGSGLLILNSSISLNQVTFSFNGNSSTTNNGGAVFIDSTSTASFTICGFNFNQAVAGGALFTNSRNVTLNRCTFFNNLAGFSGGAIQIATSDTSPSDTFVRIERSEFQTNLSTVGGGAIYNAGSNLTVVNSTFLGNEANDNGGAIENINGSTLNVFYSTFSENVAGVAQPRSGGAINTFLSTLNTANSIYWNNSATSGPELNIFAGSTANVSHSIVKGGFSGTNVLDVDPRFVRNPVRTNGAFISAGDVRLRSSSPALDAGSVAAVPETVTTDLSGSPRVQGTAPALGANETPVTVDELPPTSALASLPAATSASTLTLSWSGADATTGLVSGLASFSVFVSENGGAFTPLLTDTTLTTTDFTLTNESTYSFFVRAKDIAGNVEDKSTAEQTVIADRTAPVATISPLVPVLNQTSFNLSWSATDANASSLTFTVAVLENGTPLPNFRTNTAATSGTFTATPGRQYTFSVIARDAAGNTSQPATSSTSIPLDTTAPTSTLNPVPASPFSASGLSLLWSGADVNTGLVSGLASFTLFASENNAPFTALLTDTTQTSAFIPLNDGSTYRFFIRAKDNAGNIENKTTAEQTITIDRTAPVATITPLPTFTNQTTLNLAWSATDTRPGTLTYTISVRENNISLPNFRTDSTDTSGTFTGTPGNRYEFTVRARDAAGNISSSLPTTETSTTLDTTAPTSTLGSLPDFSNPAFSNLGSLTLFWSGDDAGPGQPSRLASFTLFVSENNAPFSPLLTDTTLTETTLPVTNGSTYRVFVRAKDNAGNVENKAAAEQTVTIDRTAPTSTLNPLPAISTSTTLNLSWSGTDTGLSGIARFDLAVSTNGGPFLRLAGPTLDTSFTFTGVDGSTYAFILTAADRAGNGQLTPSATDAITTTINTDTPLLTQLGSSASTANLTFTPTNLRLPKTVNGSIVGGTLLKGTLRVRNTGTTPATGPLSIALFLSNDTTASSKDTLLTTVSPRRPINLRPRATLSIPFSITLPTNFTGTANLLAFLNRPADSATPPIPESDTLDNVIAFSTFPLAAPLLNLTATSLTTSTRPVRAGRPTTALFTLTNNSNIPFKGTLPLLTTLTDALGSTSTLLSSSTRLNLAPGRSTRITLRFTPPATPPNPTPTTFTLRTTLDPANLFSQSQIDDSTTTTLTTT